MKKDLLKVAFMYDFDETLSPNYMQEYSLLPTLNVESSAFWKACNDFAKKHNMDPILSYMYNILHHAKEKGVKITYRDMVEQGKVVQFFEGVEEYFDKINEYGKTVGLDIEHYIISSGLKELIEGTKIGDKFKRIYACSFAYDDNDVAVWPAQAVNFTTKTQYIFRIKKDRLDHLWDQKEVNEYVTNKESLLPYSRMVYLGDGETDVPSMKVIKDKGGTSICVFNPEKENSEKEAHKIHRAKRVNFVAPADYREGSRLFEILKDVLSKIALDTKIASYSDMEEEK